MKLTQTQFTARNTVHNISGFQGAFSEVISFEAILYYNIMIDRLEAVEEGLKLWRCIVLILTIIMLLISIAGDDEMSIIVLIICFFALILFQLKNLPITSYQLFILLQLAYFVFLAGKLLEIFYYSPEKAVGNALKTAFFMITLILFMTVLWRHYQKDQLVDQMNIQEIHADG